MKALLPRKRTAEAVVGATSSGVPLQAAAIPATAPRPLPRSRLSARKPVSVYEPPRAYAFRWRDLWRYRGLLRYFGKFYVKRKYRRAWLGWLWVPLRPTYDLVGRSILFGGLLSVSSGDRPYFIFFIVGTSAWRLIQMGLLQTTRALDINRTLFGRANLPRATSVVASLVPAAIDVLIYVAIGIAGCSYYKLTRGSFYIVITPRGLAATVAGVALLALYVIALGLWISPLAFHARDARYLLNYILGFWYMITPIIYPVNSIPSASLRKLAEFNPLTGPCQLVQYGLLGTAPPHALSLLVSLVVLGAVLLGGTLMFARAEARFALAV